jgi:hypothetical protein
MKGGQTPIHFMRWAPSDYVNDPWVKLAVSRNDTGALAVYHLFLNHSFMEGGTLPADPELLAGVLGLSAPTVRKALAYWSAPERGLVLIKDGRAWNPRVRRDVAAELRFRRHQQEVGKKGGRPPAKGKPKARVFDPETPPSPSPSPAPLPAPAPTPAPAAGGVGNSNGPVRPPAAGSPWTIPHDPTNPTQLAIVRRCQDLAAKAAALDLRTATAEDLRDVFTAVSGTPKGTTLDSLLKASPEWLAETLRSCDRFEEDLTGGPPNQ